MNERGTKIAWEQVEDRDELVVRASSRRWIKDRESMLRLSAWGLEATGDLGGYKRGSLRMPWERVAELHYAPAGGGGVGGLYAREGEWCSRCVLPGVTETQADEVLALVALRQPRVVRMETGALEHAVGQAVSFGRSRGRGWMSPLGQREIAVAAPGAQV